MTKTMKNIEVAMRETANSNTDIHWSGMVELAHIAPLYEISIDNLDAVIASIRGKRKSYHYDTDVLPAFIAELEKAMDMNIDDRQGECYRILIKAQHLYDKSLSDYEGIIAAKQGRSKYRPLRLMKMAQDVFEPLRAMPVTELSKAATLAFYKEKLVRDGTLYNALVSSLHGDTGAFYVDDIGKSSLYMKWRYNEQLMLFKIKQSIVNAISLLSGASTKNTTKITRELCLEWGRNLIELLDERAMLGITHDGSPPALEKLKVLEYNIAEYRRAWAGVMALKVSRVESKEKTVIS